MRVSADGGGLTFAVASCHGKPVASVVENATEVRIKVVASTAFHGKCADSMTVHLATPLKNRHIVDVTSGHRLIIGS